MHILIVDTNNCDTQLLINAVRLRFPDAHCYACSDTLYVADFVEYFRFDFMIVSASGPTTELRSVIETMRNSNIDTRIILCAPYLSADIRENYLSDGCYAVIEQSEDLKTLLQRVELVLL